MAYATYDDLVYSLDKNLIAELSADDGVPVPGVTNANIDSALDRASAKVRSSVLVGGIYTDDDLDDLVAANDQMLVELTIALAAELLFQRRGHRITPAAEQRARTANEMLSSLRTGGAIFGSVQRNQQAGTPKTVYNKVGRVSRSSFFPSQRDAT
jgi:phage gp36-like protein